jgi:hypothetical protein
MLTIVRERVFSASGYWEEDVSFRRPLFLSPVGVPGRRKLYNLFFCRNGELRGRTRFRVFSSVRPRLLLLCTIVPSSSGQKGVVSYYFRSIRFFFSSDFLRRLLNLVICIICLSGSSVCVWISVYLALFPPTRELYRISIYSHFVKFLTDASGFGIWHHLLVTKFCVSSNLGFVLVLFPPTRDLYWISVHSRLVRFLTDASGFDILHHLFSISVCLWISAVFCPLSGNKGLTLHFDPFSLSQISYRCLWIWNCIIFLSGISVSLWISAFLALFPATRDLYIHSMHSHLVRFLTDASGFSIASSVY